jgi:hypothetical protein
MGAEDAGCSSGVPEDTDSGQAAGCSVGGLLVRAWSRVLVSSGWGGVSRHYTAAGNVRRRSRGVGARRPLLRREFNNK